MDTSPRPPSGRPAPRIRDRVPPQWWRTFFAEDYLLLYGAELTSARSERQVESVVRALRLRGGERVLDLCCGFGRHLRWLRERGLHGVGLEFSRVQLSIARRAAARRRRALALVRGDARLVPFPCCFDAVLCMYTSMGYFSDADNVRQLREAARVLKPGGRLFLDNQNPVRVLRRLKPERRTEAPHSHISILEQFEYEPESRRIYSRKEIAMPSGRREYFFVLREYRAGEIADLLALCGLVVDAAYGDYDLRPYGDDTERLIVTAHKPADAR